MDGRLVDPPRVLAFGEFVLDVANARLTRDGSDVPLSRKPFALLAELTRHAGDLVRKDHLLDTVWGRRFVSDSAVKSVLSELRSALADDARAPRWIETVPGRGYRFRGALRAAPPPPALGVTGQLPQPGTPLIGRDDACATLLDRLCGSAGQPAPRLLTLIGSPGVGKSRLALELALQLRARWRDGAWLVDLATLPPGCDAHRLRSALAHALRLSDAAARDDLALTRSLEGLSLLLLLDNAEHVLEALAPVLASLLSQTEGLQVLLTSREALRLPAEQLHPVPPLTMPDEDESDPDRCLASGAAQLFMARVRARQPGLLLDAAQTQALARLCRALDGLPLALELAAARVPALGLTGLAAQLAPADAAQRLGLVATGLRLLDGGPPRGGDRPVVRYRTLREALDWSHALLAADAQRVLRRLAVFRGPFTLAAAQAVAQSEAADDWAVLDALDTLVDASWISAPAQEPRRFRLLHGVRAYAQHLLLDAGEAAVAQARHFAVVLAHWQQADARALGDPALQWVQAHDEGIADLRAALAWGCEAVCSAPPTLPPADLLRLAAAAGLFWHRAGHADEGVRWCERVLSVTAGGTDTGLVAARAGVDLALAHLAGIAMVRPAVQGLASARRAATHHAEAGDAVRENYALYLQHTLMARADPQADRSATLARMAALQQPGWSALLRRFERSATAYEARLQGRPGVYLAFSREELARCRALGATWEAWSAGIALMLALHDNGELDAAVASGREVLAEIRAAGRLRQNANRLAMWTMMLAESGDTGQTRQALAEALPILRGAGRGGMACLAAAWLAAHEGRPGLAVQLLAHFDAPGRTGAEFGPGTFIRRSVGLLWARLRADLDDGAIAAARLQAEDAPDGEALQLLMAG